MGSEQVEGALHLSQRLAARPDCEAASLPGLRPTADRVPLARAPSRPSGAVGCRVVVLEMPRQAELRGALQSAVYSCRVVAPCHQGEARGCLVAGADSWLVPAMDRRREEVTTGE